MTLRNFVKDMYKTFILHAVAAHFSNGLVPVVATFLLILLATGDASFDTTILHLNVVVLCMVPVSFFSGIRDWRLKFHAGRAPIFYKKMWLSGALFVLCAAAVTLRLVWPQLVQPAGPLFWPYAACLLAMLPVVVLLGHYGGKLAAQVFRMEKP